MNSFTCRQTSPNSAYYKGTKTSKTGEDKIIEGEVRTLRVTDFSFTQVKRFAEDGAYMALNPQSGEKKFSDVWKGTHNGNLRGKFDRGNRKSHSERRSQIAGRAQSSNRAQ
jgi:hypothetical protein